LQLESQKIQQDGQYKQQKLSLEAADLQLKEKELELNEIRANRQAIIDMARTNAEDERTHAQLIADNDEREKDLYKFHKGQHHEIAKSLMLHDFKNKRDVGEILHEEKAPRV